MAIEPNDEATQPLGEQVQQSHQRTAALREQFEELSSTLEEIATHLCQGMPPPIELADQITSSHTAFEQLTEDILRLAESSGFVPKIRPNTLNEVQALIDAIAKASQQAAAETRQQAVKVLKEVLALRHLTDDNVCAPVYEAARQALSDVEVEEGKRLAEQLAKSEHPLAMLAAYATRADELSDEEYESYRDAIEETYGRSLLRDLDRGRITVTDTPAGETPEHVQEPDSQESMEAPIRTISLDDADMTEATQAREASLNQETSQDATLDKSDEETDSKERRGMEQRIERNGAEISTVSVEPVAEATLPAGTEGLASEEQVEVEEEVTVADEVEPESLSPATIEANAGLPWVLVHDDQLGLAYYATLALKTLDNVAEAPPAWLVRAAALGPHLRQQDTAAIEILRDELAQYDEHLGDHPEAGACNLLLVAATLTPALVTPNLTNAPAYLARVDLPGGLNALRRCVEAVSDFSSSRQPVTPAQFGSLEEAEQRFERLLKEAKEWWGRASTFTMNYAPATQVWREWVKPGGPIHNILDVVVNDRIRDAAQIRETISLLTDDKDLQREAFRVQKKKKEIEGPAWRQLVSHAREAAGFGEKWLAALERRDSAPSGDVAHTASFAATVLEVLDHAKAELKALRAEHESAPLGASALVVEHSLDALGRLLSGQEVTTQKNFFAQFDAPLLRLGIVLTDEGRPPVKEAGDNGIELANPKEVLDAIIAHIEGLPSWEEAFQCHAERRDHRATDLIIRALRAEGDDATADALEAERDRALVQCRAALERVAEAVVPRIERAFTYGLLPSEKRDQLLSRVDEVRREAKQVLRFAPLHEHLRQVEEKVETYHQEAREAVRTRFETEDLALTTDDPEYQRVEAVIASGDIHTAHDYIDRLLRGEILPESTLATTFDAFFPAWLDGVVHFLRNERPDWASLTEHLRASAAKNQTADAIGPVSFDALPITQVEVIADLLDTWFDVKRRKSINEAKAKVLLSGLGFNPLALAVERDANRIYLSVEAEIPGPNVVPVPAYGSSVNGRYRVLCAWDQPSEEELLSASERLDYGPGLIIFYFGTLPASSRRKLARLCQERRHSKGHTVLVMDDALLLFLCSQPRGSRLRALFECTLPFTITEPYKPTPGYVPPEMFYGRKQEIARILDSGDTSLVYGGRQLGKTALLRQVELDFHRPPHGVAKWLDLKFHGIGYSKTPAEVWPIVIHELKANGVLEESVPFSIQPEKLLGLLEAWLQQHPDRRILLLLDEADKFFESDSKDDFRQTAIFKGLMEQTGRRFKVVFAGLHNVYRTVRDPNQPLAHLQNPVCIGPLLDGEDKVEAARLVEQPMAALGYRFASNDLVPLILSQTNYYPSLIQIYCRQLLRDLSDTRVARFDPGTSPPYLIEPSHVRESYSHPELLKEIRDKFHLTLDLDPRYSVVAYVIAWGILNDDPEGGDVVGFPVSWIRSQALKYWHEGFEGADSEDDIDSLLDEMVGLGVLRRIIAEDEAYHRYTLRSPNVLSLLGNEEAVMKGLLREREREPEYDPATFRRTGGHGFLAPLTAQQTAALFARENGVTVIFGTLAADLDHVVDFLPGVQLETTIDVFSEGTALQDFENWLSRQSKTRRREGVTLLIVSHTIPWSEEWVRRAKMQVDRLKLQNAFVRVLFLADADTAWRFIRSTHSKPRHLLGENVDVVALGPWHLAALYHWLEGWEASVDSSGRQHIHNATGNWPALLRRFAARSSESPTQWKAHLEAFEEELMIEPEEFLRDFGLDSEPRHSVLALLAAFDEPEGLEEEELAILAEDVPDEVVSDVLRWADLLHLVRPEGRRWRLAAPLHTLLIAV